MFDREKIFLSYINKILYQESLFQTPKMFEKNSNEFVSKQKTIVDKSIKDKNSNNFSSKNLVNKINDNELKNFLDSIDNLDGNLLKKITNRLENKKDIQTDEDKFLNDITDKLKTNLNLKNKFLNLMKVNKDLPFEKIKENFNKEQTEEKENYIRQVFKDIDYFKKLPLFKQNRIIENSKSKINNEKAEDIINDFLKDEIKKEISKTKTSKV